MISFGQRYGIYLPMAVSSLYVHHDADGQLAWVTCQSGAKLWFLVVHKKAKEERMKSIKDRYQFHDQLLPDSREIPDGFKVCSVLLEPGKVL